MLGLGIAVLGFCAYEMEMFVADYVVLSLEQVTYMDFDRAYKRHHGIPWDILETKRTYIREFCMEDFEDLCNLYAKDHVTDFIEPLYPRQQELDYQQTYIEKIYGFYGFGMWLVFDKETNKLIGRAGIEYREPCEEGQVELGYVIDPDFQGRGYATEVCKAIISYTRDVLEMKSILCRVNVANDVSKHLLENLGFEKSVKKDEEIFELSLLN